ncbi:Endonuclease/exonuclease/phosphatase [Podospora didyma]|uniref:DNA-(apurinic or apyrimidinic site) endonuclease 2 n=1 Tax=Podospora didyma TaxID=330526 RepID=A0AAE0K9H5_9PEZI|nr:Endonuclease/exonuclease/phosphatase [Podospora didyma]
MGLRITTWNVNGIRNPFSYLPWSENRTYQSMFDKLGADIVIMQETKIQRKDLQDDMVLVPGWDVYFSLPKYKKGYSGVAIYTRSSRCSPIRAEEGITGILCPPNSSIPFRKLPADQQIGGYPADGQLDVRDEATLDSEGRCVILEFPAFVLIGVYCPAARDETRTEFRQAFLDALDIRVRNLAAMGKQVVLCGDLNIIRTGLDTAALQERLRKDSMTFDEFISMPPRRFLNQLVFNGQVIGERDEGRENPVMWDLCREFHPLRERMFTCWETRKNARPGNFGSRIDYVLCSASLKHWVIDANIQEGLLGSDHCPVYATIDDMVTFNGRRTYLADIMNPEGMFKDGKRLRDWSPKDLLPMSAKLIPDFDRRQSIRDMFAKKATAMPKSNLSALHTNAQSTPSLTESGPSASDPGPSLPSSSQPTTSISASPQRPLPAKRQSETSSSSSRPQKKSKATLNKENSTKTGSGPAQRSLMGFFKPKTPAPDLNISKDTKDARNTISPSPKTNTGWSTDTDKEAIFEDKGAKRLDPFEDDAIEDWPDDTLKPTSLPNDSGKVFDPIQSKESWSKLLGKRVVPKCEHGDECQSLVTKKPGVNCGRSFYVCPRPLGPSGDKEQGTEFRCKTFIWSSDWSGRQ